MKRLAPLEVTLAWKKQCCRLAGSDSESIIVCDDSNDESVCSVQLVDTDTAKDTSDSALLSEYEVAGLSPDRPNPFFSTDDSDEVHELNEIVQLGAVAASVSANLSDLDLGQLADTSVEPSSSPTSNSDVDPGLPRQDFLDFWHCAQCKEPNLNRHVPFCPSCYSMRKKFFPPRPSRQRLPLPAVSVGTATDSGLSADVVDGPSPSQSSANTSSETGDARNADMCQICYNKPANGLFSHGRSAHRYACYGCAKRTWRLMGQCPLCRKKIDRILKLL